MVNFDLKPPRDEIDELPRAEPRDFGRAAADSEGPKAFPGRVGDAALLARKVIEHNDTASDDKRGSRALPLFIAFLALGAFGVIVWYAYSWGVGDGATNGLPVVQAPEGPDKELPSEPGGLEVPHQDKMVLNRGDESAGEETVERLLPPPEEPRLPETPQLGNLPGLPPIDTASGDGEAATVLDSRQLEPFTAETTEAPREVTAAPEPQAPQAPQTPAAPESVYPTAGTCAPTAAAPVEEAAEAEAPVAPETKPEEITAAEPAPVAEPSPAPAPAPEPTQQAAAATGGYFVQLLSVKDRENAEAAWSKLQGKYPSILGSSSYKVEEADLGDRGVFYRLLAGPVPSDAEASALCGKLEASGQGCLVRRP